MDKAAREKALELCDFSPILMPAFCVAVLINLTKQALCALDAAEAESAGLRDGTALEYTAVLQDSLENAVTDLKDARATNARLQARVSELEAALEWRPISEAPHAEKLLLGWWESFNGVDYTWNCVVGQASWGFRNEAGSNVSQHGHATHWRHLPAPEGGRQ